MGSLYEPQAREAKMAQAQIAPKTRRWSLWSHVTAFLTSIRRQGQQRRDLVRFLAHLDSGHATGARV